MTRNDKLIARAMRSPRDFTWDEMCTLLHRLGFDRIEGAGSRVRFQLRFDRRLLIKVHAPHGRHPRTMLVASVNEVVNKLRSWGLIE